MICFHQSELGPQNILADFFGDKSQISDDGTFPLSICNGVTYAAWGIVRRSKSANRESADAEGLSRKKGM